MECKQSFAMKMEATVSSIALVPVYKMYVIKLQGTVSLMLIAVRTRISRMFC
jgi:hypothetical protein